MTRWSAVREVLLHERSGALAIRLLRKTVGHAFWVERVAFYALDLTPEAHERVASTVDFKVIVATPDDLLNRYIEPLEVNFNLAPEKIAKRLSRSHTAVLAVHGVEPIAMVWLAFDEQEVSELGRTLVLQPGEVLTYDEFTLPKWRGRRISPSINQFADEYAFQRLAKRRITWRRLSNAPAIRVAERLGHKLLAVATVVRLASASRPIVLGLASTGLQLEVRRPDNTGTSLKSLRGRSKPDKS